MCVCVCERVRVRVCMHPTLAKTAGLSRHDQSIPSDPAVSSSCVLVPGGTESSQAGFASLSK